MFTDPAPGDVWRSAAARLAQFLRFLSGQAANPGEERQSCGSWCRSANGVVADLRAPDGCASARSRARPRAAQPLRFAPFELPVAGLIGSRVSFMTLWRPLDPALRQLRRSSLGAKLALLGGLSTVCVVGAAFAALRISTVTVVRREFVNDLRVREAQLRQGQDHDRRLMLQSAEMATVSTELQQALALPAARRDAAVTHAAGQIMHTIDADVLLITDDLGGVITGAGADAGHWRGASLQAMPAVAHALVDRQLAAASAFGVLRDGVSTAEVAAVPLRRGSRTVGVLLVGRRLGRVVAADTNTRLIVVSRGVVLASTLAPLPAGELWPSPTSDLAGGSATVTLHGVEFAAVDLPLGVGQNGGQVDLYLVRSLDAALDPIELQLSHSFALAGLIAVLLAWAGGVLLSRTTLRPLGRFVEFMQRGAATDHYARFTEPHAPQEIRSLTDTYNHLIESLQHGHQELEDRTIDLAKVNHRLNRQMDRRERAERALHDSEEQLRQAQKLEALGALAGGVAHDFNNILSIILGYAEIVQADLPETSSQHADINRISEAAMRARALIRQLLAFSRKQVLQPQVLDLNQVVADVQVLLGPLAGGGVDLQLRLAANVAPVMADPTQVEQVIINLAVNARDAMPDGGVLVIETANVMLDESACHHPLPPGPVVMLSVADTGVGMDAATRRRIFEPFFTTKPVGKGTGLGLATVYGIVRQSGGNITVFSEPGVGTTFRCYFPPVTADIPDEVPADSGIDGAAGGETVLLAQVESEIRNLTRRSLERQGYEVLIANSGAEAVDIAQDHAGPIHVLVTDLVMPGAAATDLAAQLTAIRPGLRVVFTSGSLPDATDRDGTLLPDAVYLPNRFSPEDLSRVLRELLDAAFAAQDSH
jgi:signal transduction histidine kinase/ActR/RegA family two-component response regulator